MTSCQRDSLSPAAFIWPHTHLPLLEPSVSDFRFQCAFTLGWYKTHQADDTDSQDATAKYMAVSPSPSLPPQRVKCAVVTRHRPPSKSLLSTKLANPAQTRRKHRQVLQDSRWAGPLVFPSGNATPGGADRGLSEIRLKTYSEIFLLVDWMRLDFNPFSNATPCP